MASAKPTTVRFEPEDQDRIEAWKERFDAENQSDAVKEMVRVADREARNPLTYRLKDEVIEWVGYLGVSAVIVFVGGATTPVLPIGEAALFSISLVVVAGLLLAGYELVRLLLGQNELGDQLRETFRGEHV